MEAAARRIFATPFGWAGVVATGRGIARIVLPRKSRLSVERDVGGAGAREESAGAVPAAATRLAARAAGLIGRALSGARVRFDLPLDLRHHTVFQQAVWRAAAKIPAGETRSYAWVAKNIGRPKAARAVGQALGANPVPVVVPCHRVVSSAGTLGGFSGGLPMKRRLLAIEAGRPACMAEDRRK